MAGSYNHVITEQGNLRSNESFLNSIGNLGDAYEAVEEMYGMIWWLAYNDHSDRSPVDAIEKARQEYKVGLQIAKATTNKGETHGS